MIIKQIIKAWKAIIHSFLRIKIIIILLVLLFYVFVKFYLIQKRTAGTQKLGALNKKSDNPKLAGEHIDNC